MNSNTHLSVYFESTLTDGGYSSILKENNWIVEEELVDDYYLATSPDKKYIIHYLYLPNYGALDIYFDTAKEFPTELINQFFKKYEVTGISIPVYEGALGGFVFAENPNNETYIEMGYPENISATVICYTASEQSYLNYLTKLKGLNWKINKSTSSADATYNLSDAIYSMSIKYSSNENAAVITVSGYLEKIGDNGWPSTSIKAILPSGITDVVPAFEGNALGYKILNDAWGTAVYVQVTKGTELDCVESYKATLLENGYTFSHKDSLGDLYYLSPNKQLVVGVYYATPGSITIPFEAAESN